MSTGVPLQISSEEHFNPFSHGKGCDKGQKGFNDIAARKVSNLSYVHLLDKSHLRIPSARLKFGPTVVPNTVTPESMAPKQPSK